MGFLKKAFKGIGKVAKGLLGMDSGKDLGSKFDEQLRVQQEAAKLNAANEIENVAQFEDTSTDTFTGSDTRKKKRGAGAYSSTLGLQL